MDSYTEISKVEEQFKVRFLDESIRAIRRKTQLPWQLTESTLRVFSDVLIYPVKDDHDELAFFDNNQKSWSLKPRARFTSVKEFLQNPPNEKNDLTELFDGGTRFLGFRYKPLEAGSSLLNNAETNADWSVSDDATAIVDDTVFFKEGNASQKISITSSAGVATIEADNTSISDSEYKQKYFFIWVYLDSVPTSLELRFGNDSSNYLYSDSITTQFSGQAFKADGWNLLAFDLNEASEQGTVSDSAFDYQAIILTGAATGTYYVDASYLRQWELLDFYYYSKYSTATNGAVVPDQEYFMNSSETYKTDTGLVGDSEWADVIQYEGMVSSLIDRENTLVLKEIKAKRSQAWADLFSLYPSMRPQITTSRWNFETDYTAQYGGSSNY